MKTRNKVDYVALNKPYIDTRMLVKSVTRHRNYETNKGFEIVLSVIGHKAQVSRFSFKKLKVGSFATLNAQGNLGGISSAQDQKIMAKEDYAFDNAMSSLAVLAKTTQHNPSS